MDFFRQHSAHQNLVCIGFESVGIGKTTYQNLERERFPVYDLQPKGDKFTRALSAAIRLGMKTTYFKEDAFWLNDFLDELLHFPNGKNDDQVDCLSYADYMIFEGIVANYVFAPSNVSKIVGYSYNSKPSKYDPFDDF